MSNQKSLKKEIRKRFHFHLNFVIMISNERTKQTKFFDVYDADSKGQISEISITAKC